MSDDTQPGAYLIGYGKPPAQHRFKKGRSGNPRGRPRRQPERRDERFDFGAEPTRRFILEEAYRPITFREGDKSHTLPTMQAVMRAMAVQALKGNRLAQKTLAEFVQRIEGADYALRFDYFKTMVEYKENWEEEIQRCETAGLPIPEPVPHPGDIEIDMDSASVRICGPKTPQQKAKFDRGLEQAREHYLTKLRLTRTARRRPLDPLEVIDLNIATKVLDKISSSLSERYWDKVFGESKGSAKHSRHGRTR